MLPLHVFPYGILSDFLYTNPGSLSVGKDRGWICNWFSEKFKNATKLNRVILFSRKLISKVHFSMTLQHFMSFHHGSVYFTSYFVHHCHWTKEGWEFVIVWNVMFRICCMTFSLLLFHLYYSSKATYYVLIIIFNIFKILCKKIYWNYIKGKYLVNFSSPLQELGNLSVSSTLKYDFFISSPAPFLILVPSVCHF